MNPFVLERDMFTHSIAWHLFICVFQFFWWLWVWVRYTAASREGNTARWWCGARFGCHIRRVVRRKFYWGIFV